MRPFRIARSRLTTCCGHGSAGARPGRRDLLAGAATSLAGLYAMMRSSSAEAQVRAFPPPPPAVSPVEGLIDFHLHSAPDVFGRAFDDEEAGIVYRDNGIEAVVMKSHVVATADRAWLLRKHVPNMKAFGGVVLNAAVGGINPDAVQWMWRMQGSFGRVVWFPTFDADHHVKHFKDGPEGIKVLGSDGNVLPAVREVLKICAQQKLVVCTGHLSPAEALAVARAAREAGCDRVAITHSQFEVVNLSLEEMKQAAAIGAKMEICAMGPLMGPAAHLSWMRSWRQVPLKESADRIKAVGAEHFLLATDLGQTGNPSPPDGYKLLVAGLLAEGITKDQIRQMGREVPGRLLMG
ncbi:MAG: histidinol phosphatase [Deltaproteobacteria bacterium]|nr:MAG: histidinol phosphatase [Deltaproteobacteria bacterium]